MVTRGLCAVIPVFAPAAAKSIACSRSRFVTFWLTRAVSSRLEPRANDVEQSITDDIGLFGRWSWNNGKTEIMSFTDIDASLSLGTSIKGTAFTRVVEDVAKLLATKALSRAEAERWMRADDFTLLEREVQAARWYDIRCYERMSRLLLDVEL